MAVHHASQARDVANEFREIVQQDEACVVPENVMDRLTLLIEAAIDTAVLEQMERVASDVGDLARKYAFDAENYRTRQ